MLAIDELKDLVRRVEAGEVKLPEPDPDAAALATAIEELNARYFVVTREGQTVVAEEVYDDILKRNRLVYMRAVDLKLLYQNRKVTVGRKPDGSPISKDLGSAWLDHPGRRTFLAGIDLIPPPGACPEGTYNLWRGFGVEPKAGAWPLIHQHLSEVICAGDQAAYDWLLRWCAYCVQHPSDQAGVAIVLRGDKGTGKGSFASMLRRIFRDHNLQVTNPAQFTGRFNMHLQDTLFLFVDEAFWAGDKASEGVLKSLVTEPTITIEPKHVNAFTVRNRLKILMASNNDWVVPATAGERRFFVLDVSSVHKDDREYFDPLFDAIEGEELAAFLHNLLALDLTGFNRWKPPHTKALNEQKLLSTDSFENFWYACLYEGVIVGLDDSDGEGWKGWPETVPCQGLYRAYIEHARGHGERYPANAAQLGKKLAASLPPGFRTVKPYQGARHYVLPGLEACRAAFLETMKIQTEWEWPAVEDVEEDSDQSDF